MAPANTLSDDRAEAVRILKAYLRAPEERRTVLLRELATVLVNAREHFSTADGSTDWKGRTHAYRSFVREIYDAARVPREDTPKIQASVRYHVGSVLRERLDEDTLEDLGLKAASPRERSVEQRANRSALLNALTYRDVAGGSLLALSAAYTVLQRLDAEDLAELDAPGRETARNALANLERRTKQLQAVLG